MKKLMIAGLISLIAVTAFAEDTMIIQCENVSVEAPLGWLAQYTRTPNLLFLYSPLEENDTFQENMNVTVEQLPRAYSVEEYMDASMGQLKRIYSDLKVNETSDNRHIISGVVSGIPVKQLQYFFVQDEVAYVLTFSSNQENFDRYYEDFELIADSFKIIKE